MIFESPYGRVASEAEQLRAELARVTASAEQWRQQVLVQDRQIARLTKTKERHKLRIAQAEGEKTELRREVESLLDQRAQIAVLLGLSAPAQDHTSNEKGPVASGETPAACSALPSLVSVGGGEEAEA